MSRSLPLPARDRPPRSRAKANSALWYGSCIWLGVGGCYIWLPIEERPLNELPTIELSNPEEGMPIEIDPNGGGVDVFVVVHDDEPETLFVLWETGREGIQSQYTVSTGVGKDDVGYELYLPPDTRGEQTLFFRVEDDFGEQATREWDIVLLEAP